MSKSKSRRIPKPVWFAVATVAAMLIVVLWVFLAVRPRYNREQIVVRGIERLGGEVDTEWDGPTWLSVFLDDVSVSWFDRVYLVALSETVISNEGLKRLGGLTNLRMLLLTNTKISDDGMKHLSGLTNLQFLWLENTQITDEGLKHLRSLPFLIYVDLTDTKVTNEGIKELQKAVLGDSGIFR
jgi:hypothetical protein